MVGVKRGKSNRYLFGGPVGKIIDLLIIFSQKRGSRKLRAPVKKNEHISENQWLEDNIPSWSGPLLWDAAISLIQQNNWATWKKPVNDMNHEIPIGFIFRDPDVMAYSSLYIYKVGPYYS